MDYHGWIAIFFGVLGIVAAAAVWYRYSGLESKYLSDISRVGVEMVAMRHEIADLKIELARKDAAIVQKDQIILRQAEYIEQLEGKIKALEQIIDRREWGGDK